MNNYEPRKEKAAANLILAKQYHQAGDLAGAKRLYDKILAGDPRHVEALHLKGVLFYQKGEPVVAVKMIQQALLLSPNYIEAQANLGLAYEALGKLESAEHCYRDLLRKNRNLAGVHNNLGFVLQSLGRTEEAFVSYRNSLEIEPNFVQAHFNFGRAYQEKGELDDALESFQKAVSIKPDFSEAIREIGLIFYARGLFDKAAISFQKYITIDPNCALGHNYLGLALQEIGLLNEALRCYQTALAVDPDSVSAYYNLGMVWFQSGFFQKSIKSYQKLLSLKPKDPETITALAINYWKNNDPESCLEIIKNLPKPETEGVHGKGKKFISGYHYYLKLLCEYRNRNPTLYNLDTEFSPLVCIGDSHCLSPAHTSIGLLGTDYCVSPELIIGCKAWHLGNSANNKYKSQFERISCSLKPSSQVMVMFGEIDCRYNEGIIKHHRKSGTNLQVSIQDVVSSYVEYVLKIFKKNNLSPIFYGVPYPSQKMIHRVPKTDTKILLETIEIFNDTLQGITQRNFISYFDVYNFTKSLDPNNDENIYIDKTHLIPLTLHNIIESEQAYLV